LFGRFIIIFLYAYGGAAISELIGVLNSQAYAGVDFYFYLRSKIDASGGRKMTRNLLLKRNHYSSRCRPLSMDVKLQLLDHESAPS